MSPAHPTTRRSRGFPTFAAAAAAVVIGSSGCSIDLSEFRPGAGGEEPSPSPTPVKAAPLLQSALDSLGQQPAVAVQGQVSEDADSPVSDVSLTTTDAGTANGTVQTNENEAEVMQADGKLFANAPDAYWLDKNITNPDADDYAGSWVRLNGDQLGVDPAAMLAPTALADIIGSMAPAGGKAELENLDGTTAYRVDLAGGESNRVWIGEESGELLRAEIEELTPEGADSGPRTRLDFTVPEGPDVQTLYDDVLTVAQDGLKGAPDARMGVNWSEQLSLDCQTGGACEVSGTAEDTSSGDGEGDDTSVLVRMDATVENDELGSKECNDSARVKAGGTADLSCGVNFSLQPSTSPVSYEMSGDARLSTSALSGDARKDLIAAVKEERDAASDGSSPSEDASESPAGEDSAGD
ncbi:hypothetical protein LP52_16595 [Streptomonospora alba]|uniref:Uncharacterized protein n=1 Tax=Streptomonospora alba TaxID=183763 RepID=A0A0C2JGA7_9ACTN|nr:hypothetical protein [Streptomonospora alba]KIH97940.1 hypothetical protein LP52_16595 [Streptomonospora alba]